MSPGYGADSACAAHAMTSSGGRVCLDGRCTHRGLHGNKEVWETGKHLLSMPRASRATTRRGINAMPESQRHYCIPEDAAVQVVEVLA